MARCIFIKFSILFFFVFHASLFTWGLPSLLYANGIKTSYKRYSIFKVKNEEILCEPYVVSKDDWLYKIFRKKGEISEKDFPYFLLIFKEINPQISNIDAIAPGIHILIPLKKVQKKDYDQSTPGTVDVPVVEFSTIQDDPDLAPFLKKHQIQKGDNISELIDKGFLDKGGALSQEGIKAFQIANPHIKNINIVYEGQDIYLPDPSIKSQPWFQSFFTNDNQPSETGKDQTSPEINKIEEHQLIQLKRYSSLIGGTLLSQGKMYFPEKGGSETVLDLSSSPVINASDGSKILILSGENVNDQLLKSVQAYWKDLKVQLISETLEQAKDLSHRESVQIPSRSTEYKNMVKNLLSQTEYDYIPETKIPFTLNNIQLEASFGRVIREDSTDLLINFGNVYGTALEVLEKKEFKIISITSKNTPIQLANILFSNLGFDTWENPSFFTGSIIETINGLYAVKDKERLFIPTTPLTSNAAGYLKKENINILSMEGTTTTSH